MWDFLKLFNLCCILSTSGKGGGTREAQTGTCGSCMEMYIRLWQGIPLSLIHLPAGSQRASLMLTL